MSAPTQQLDPALLDRIHDRAPAHDRDGSFPHEDLAELQEAGYLAALVPADLGGWGLTLEQLAAEQMRLAASAPATALAVNMHLVWTAVAKTLHDRGDASLDFVLQEAAAGEIFAFGVSEAGNDLVLFGSTVDARPLADGGVAYTGTKTFTSLSPVWTRLGTFGLDTTIDDAPRIVWGFLDRTADGIETIEDWDPLGQRATCSDTTHLTEAVVRADRVVRRLPPGPNPDPLIFGVFVNFEILLAAVYAGLSHRAVQLAAEAAKRRTSLKSGGAPRSDDPDIRRRVATAALLDDALDAQVLSLARDVDTQANHGARWFAKASGLKVRVTEGAKAVVDEAIQVGGGSGYAAGSELSRLYRDVLAGAFNPSTHDSALNTIASAVLGPRAAEPVGPISEDAGRYGHRRLILAICCLSLFIVTLDATVTNVALPAISRDLHAGVSSLQWTLDAYTLTIASLLVLAGSSGDRFGRRRTFQTGLVVFAIGSLLCSLAVSDGMLIASRVLQAVGGAMLNPVSLSIVTNTFTEKAARARALGVWGAISGAALAAGPAIGGLLVDSIGWRSIFWVNVPVAIAAIVLTALFVPESRSGRVRRFDPAGQVLVIVALASVVFAIIEGPRLGWASPVTIGAFVLGAGALAAFVPVESRRTEPLIDPRFFRSVPFTCAVVSAVLAFGAWGAFVFTNTLVLQDVRGLSAMEAGLLFAPAGLAVLASSPLSGRLTGTIGTRLPMTLAGLMIVAAAVVLTFTTASSPIAVLLVVFVLFGFGFGFVNPPITNTAVSGMPNAQAGSASALTSTGRQLGTALGIALAGSITGSSSGSRVSSSLATDAHPLWWTIAAAGALIVVLAALSNSARAARSSQRVAPLLAEPAPSR